jgi:hypothetical protein
MSNAKYILVAIILFASASLYFSSPAESKTIAETQPLAPQTAAPKYALLVGINRYKPGPKKVGDLYGTHNDVALMKSFLQENNFGYTAAADSPTAPCGAQAAASQVKTLCSEQATKSAILGAFRTQLVDNAKNYWKGKAADPAKGPQVVFYYSGHGSQVEDETPLEGETADKLVIDEPDGLDETLVPYDTDQDGSRDIRDDEFKKLFDELKQYTQNITFISDSCHSGTITRGDGMKGFVRDFPNLKAKGTGSRGATTDKSDGDGVSADPGYVTISGSLPTQFSFEAQLPTEPGKPMQKGGLLTFYFVNLAKAHPDATYRELIEMVRSAISTHSKPQTPQVEGAVDRPLFGMAGTARKRAISIKCEGTGDKAVCFEPSDTKSADGKPVYSMTINAGQIVGARTGGPVVIYAPNAAELAGETGKVAEGTILNADAFSAYAEVTLTDAGAAQLADAKTKKDLQRAKVVLLAPSFTDAKRKVAVDVSSAAGDVGKEIVKALAESSYVTAVESSELIRQFEVRRQSADSGTSQPEFEWELAIVRGTYGQFKEGRAAMLAASKNVPPADDQAGYFLVDRSGIAIYDQFVKADQEGVANILNSKLESHVKAQNVRGLRNEAAKFSDKVSVKMTPYKRYRQNRPSPQCATPYTGEELQRLPGGVQRVGLDQAFRLDITNNHDKPLYFYVYSVDANSKVSLAYPQIGQHEALAAGKTWSPNAANPCALFAFSPTDPTGFETVKVIFSESPFPAELLEVRGTRNANAPGGNSLLARLIDQAGSNTRTALGGGSVGDWTTLEVSYNVVPPVNVTP